MTILILASPAFYFPNQLPPLLASLGLAAGLGAWLAGSLTTRAAVRRSPFDLSLLLLLSMLIPSLYASADWSQSLPNLTRIALGVMLFSTLGRALRAQRQWTRTYWRVIPAASLGLAGLFLLGIQWIGKFEWLAPIYALLPRFLDAVPHYAEIKGFHPNPVAGVLLFFVPVLLAIAFAGSQQAAGAREPDRTRNLWSLLAGGEAGSRLDSMIRLVAPFPVIGLVILTQSRSALLGLALAFVLWLVYRFRILLPFILPLTAACVVALIFIGIDQAPTILLGGVDVSSPLGSLNSLPGRLELWQRAVYMLQDFPYTGVGLNMFPRVLQVLYPPFSFSPDTLVPHAHNQLLQVGVDLGIPGLVAYIGLIACFFYSNARVMVRSGHPQRRALAGGLLFGMLAFQTFGLFDAIALGSEPDLIFWIALALSAGLNIRESLTNSEIPRREYGPGRREEPAESFQPGPGTILKATREFGRPFFVWIMGSLLSIAFVGDQPYLGLVLALLSGIAVGLAGIIAYDRASAAGSLLQVSSPFVQVR